MSPRSALLGLLVGLGLPLACNGSTNVETRTVTLHAPAACAVGTSSYALGKSPYALFDPLGDFPPVEALPSLPLSETGTVLAGFPANTEEVVATVTGASAQWEAHALLPSSGPVDLLALPSGFPCALTDPIDARVGGALGAVDELHLLVAGGTSSTGVPRTDLVDLARGVVTALPGGLLDPRTGPTITPFSGGAVVAGGTSLEGNAPSFELYSTSAGDFDGETYPLSQARVRHGAVALAGGDTLLVGGVDANGDVLGSMEAIDPIARRARTGGLAFLSVPRADPVVVRLASGEILVAGGVDASGAPVSTIEWFTADGSQLERTRALVASSHEVFVPLAAGGALAVIAPDAVTPGFQNTWIISAGGAIAAAASIEGALTDPRLLQGTEQEPVLWTGDRYLVWQPWQGAFAALDSAIGAPGPSGDPIASPEPGLGVWLDGTTVRALRFGTRGPYATTSSPLFAGADGTAFTAPDQLVSTDASGPITFDPDAGLTLESGASVFVTDATFASFTLDAETPGNLAPAFVLRDDAGNETVLNAAACGLASGESFHVEREGGVVRASVDGGALATCGLSPASGSRVSVGVRGAASTPSSVVRSLVLTRT